MTSDVVLALVGIGGTIVGALVGAWVERQGTRAESLRAYRRELLTRAWVALTEAVESTLHAASKGPVPREEADSIIRETDRAVRPIELIDDRLVELMNELQAALVGVLYSDSDGSCQAQEAAQALVGERHGRLAQALRGEIGAIPARLRFLTWWNQRRLRDRVRGIWPLRGTSY